MNDRPISPLVAPAGDTTQQDTLPPVPPRPVQPSGWTARSVTSLVVGCLLAFIALPLLGAGGTALWAHWTQRDAGMVTSDTEAFSTAGSALATVPTHLGTSGTGWLYAPAVLGPVRMRVTPVNPGSDLFVGVGPSAEVDRYLATAGHTVISDFWTNTTYTIDGGTALTAPAAQTFWVASSTGVGPRTMVWEPTDGSWTVVVMNADGRSGIDVTADLAARIPALPWIAIGLLVVGGLFATGGILLISTTVRRRSTPPSTV